METKLIKLNPFGVLLSPIGNSKDIKKVNVEYLRSLFKEHHLVLLRGFDTFQTSEEFSKYSEGWGAVSVWPFGTVLELIERENPEDHIFDNNYVPLHWDGMYRPEVPEYQIFHCVKAPLPEQGGRTTFTNTILALENVSLDDRKVWEKVIGSYERKMEFYNSKITSPLIANHPYQNYKVIRYNEPPSEKEGNFLNPPNLKFKGVSQDDEATFHQKLKDLLYHPKNFYAHEWKVGDVVIADNFTLLHGREKFISKSPRHLQRVQVLSNPPFKNPGLEFYK